MLNNKQNEYDEFQIISIIHTMLETAVLVVIVYELEVAMTIGRF